MPGMLAIRSASAFNKIDHVGDAAAQAERESALRAQYPDCIVMSVRCEVLEERADEAGVFLRIRGERETVKSLCERFDPVR